MPKVNTLKLLTETVEELTKPIPHTWVTDHGTTVQKSTPCLLDQLREAIEDCESRPATGKGRGRKNQPDLLDFRALDLEQDIKNTVNKYYRRYRREGEDFKGVKRQLRSWAANACRYKGEAVKEASLILSGYRKAILEIFNPHTIEIKAPCPRCNMLHKEKVIDEKKIRSSALKANSDSVICTACKYVWNSSRFMELGRQITMKSGKCRNT